MKYQAFIASNNLDVKILPSRALWISSAHCTTLYLFLFYFLFFRCDFSYPRALTYSLSSTWRKNHKLKHTILEVNIPVKSWQSRTFLVSTYSPAAFFLSSLSSHVH